LCLLNSIRFISILIGIKPEGEGVPNRQTPIVPQLEQIWWARQVYILRHLQSVLQQRK